VEEDDGRGGGDDGGLEYLARMDQQGIKRTGGDELVADDAAAGVDAQDVKGFDRGLVIRAGQDVLVVIVPDLFRIGDVQVAHGAFAEHNHLEFHGGELAMFAGRINDTDFKGIQGKLLVVEGEFVHL